MGAAPPELPARRASTGAIAAVVAVFVVAVGIAYHGVWCGVWIFDDGPALAENDALRAGDWWQAAFGPVHTPLAGRPLTCASLALDFAIFGTGPFGPHLGNLLLHLGNALLLFACVRAALRAPNLAGTFQERHTMAVAAAIGVVWAVHPLGVDAVAYATQRSTLLAAAFVLLAVLATLRREHAPARVWWSAVAVVASGCAMASKEDAVVVPFLVLLAERAFVVPDWSALRSRWRFQIAVAATWGVLVFCVVHAADNPTVGWNTRSGVTAWSWLLTEAGVVARYLCLAAWPSPLRGFYDLGVVTSVGDAALGGAVVSGVLALAIAAWRRWPWLGWLGALWFLGLAPTSTILPIVTEIAAERRVYLPMLFVVAPVVVALVVVPRRGPRWIGWCAIAGLAIGGAFTTRARVAVYADPGTFWSDAYAKRAPGARTFLAGILLANMADVLDAGGRTDDAAALLDDAMACDGPTSPAICRHALSLSRRGRHREAIDEMQRLVAGDPSPRAAGTLGVCLAVAHEAEHAAGDDSRLGAAEAALRPATVAHPREAQFWSALGYVLRARGRFDAAEQAYERLTRCEPEESAPYLIRAELLERLGRGGEVGPWMQGVLAARPAAITLHLDWAAWSVHHGDLATARALVARVLARAPGEARAAAMDRELRAMPQSR